uniref:Uncharacterized protein n=2 Tax=Helianthus annuus TaxID=4232 RepID=A0A251V6U7_HELAN
MASTNFRLPDNVSRMAKLDSDFKPITVRLLHLTQQQEFTNRTRRENKEKGVRYALCRWSRFMKLALRSPPRLMEHITIAPMGVTATERSLSISLCPLHHHR